MEVIVIIILVLLATWFIRRSNKINAWKEPKESFPPKWGAILSKKVPYFNALNAAEQKSFGIKSGDIQTWMRSLFIQIVLI